MTESLIKKFPNAWEELKDGEKEKVLTLVKNIRALWTMGKLKEKVLMK